MTLRILKILAIIAVTALVAGCKLAIVVVEGGHVEGLNSPDCVVGTNCVVSVTDTDFSESFTAVPAPGWQFVKWNSGGNFFCANSVNPTCSLSLAGTAGNAAVETLVASSKTFYIMPVFERLPGGLPITDTITVDGKQWAQPDLFLNLQWRDMNVVCPNSICNGILNGYEMSGWTWASVDQINALLNHYIGSEQLGPGPDSYYPVPTETFWGDGWRPTADLNAFTDHLPRLYAFTSTCTPSSNGRSLASIGSMAWLGLEYYSVGSAGTSGYTYHYTADCSDDTYNDTSKTGGWFYRTP